MRLKGPRPSAQVTAVHNNFVMGMLAFPSGFVLRMRVMVAPPAASGAYFADDKFQYRYNQIEM
jgi:hypothetical protein